MGDDFTPTDEQYDAIGAFLSGQNLAIRAAAGTGKTTTLELLARNTQRSGQYVTFSKALATEARRRFPLSVDTATGHSLAFSRVGRQYGHRLGGERMRSYELAKLLGLAQTKLVVRLPQKTKVLQPGYLAGLVMRAMRRFYQSASDEPGPEHVPFVFGIDEAGQRANNNVLRDTLAPVLGRAWEDIRDPAGVLPFDHDAYLAIACLNGLRVGADFLLVDEVQDFTMRQVRWLREIQGDTQIVVVGDSDQQLFEWRGAVDCFQHFEVDETTKLSMSFRFGEAIADVANEVLDALGSDMRVRGAPWVSSSVGYVEKPTAILCRTNAKAVEWFFDLKAKGRDPFLVGGGTDVLYFAQAAARLQHGEPAAHAELACFDTWPEVVSYCGLDKKADPDPLASDLVMLVKLVEEYGAGTIIAALEGMGAEEASDVIVSTGHKGKGREFETVKLANDFEEPKAGQEGELRLRYVAVTRAKLRLDMAAVAPMPRRLTGVFGG